MTEEGIVHLSGSGSGGVGEGRKTVGDLPTAIFLTAQIERGVADDRRDFQWDDFAALMALK